METPGSDLAVAGLRELAAGRASPEAPLVSAGAAGLRAVGVAVPDPPPVPELRLDEPLAEEDPDAAHPRSHGLVRRLVGVERASECECAS